MSSMPLETRIARLKAALPYKHFSLSFQQLVRLLRGCSATSQHVIDSDVQSIADRLGGSRAKGVELSRVLEWAFAPDKEPLLENVKEQILDHIQCCIENLGHMTIPSEATLLPSLSVRWRIDNLLSGEGCEAVVDGLTLESAPESSPSALPMSNLSVSSDAVLLPSLSVRSRADSKSSCNAMVDELTLETAPVADASAPLVDEVVSEIVHACSRHAYFFDIGSCAQTSRQKTVDEVTCKSDAIPPDGIGDTQLEIFRLAEAQKIMRQPVLLLAHDLSVDHFTPYELASLDNAVAMARTEQEARACSLRSGRDTKTKQAAIEQLPSGVQVSVVSSIEVEQEEEVELNGDDQEGPTVHAKPHVVQDPESAVVERAHVPTTRVVPLLESRNGPVLTLDGGSRESQLDVRQFLSDECLHGLKSGACSECLHDLEDGVERGLLREGLESDTRCQGEQDPLSYRPVEGLTTPDARQVSSGAYTAAKTMQGAEVATVSSCALMKSGSPVPSAPLVDQASRVHGSREQGRGLSTSPEAIHASAVSPMAPNELLNAISRQPQSYGKSSARDARGSPSRGWSPSRGSPSELEVSTSQGQLDSPDRANVIYFKNQWEERSARAVLVQESGFEEPIALPRSPERYTRPSTGYSLRYHVCREEGKGAFDAFNPPFKPMRVASKTKRGSRLSQRNASKESCSSRLSRGSVGTSAAESAAAESADYGSSADDGEYNYGESEMEEYMQGSPRKKKGASATPPSPPWNSSLHAPSSPVRSLARLGPLSALEPSPTTYPSLQTIPLQPTSPEVKPLTPVQKVASSFNGPVSPSRSSAPVSPARSSASAPKPLSKGFLNLGRPLKQPSRSRCVLDFSAFSKASLYSEADLKYFAVAPTPEPHSASGITNVLQNTAHNAATLKAQRGAAGAQVHPLEASMRRRESGASIGGQRYWSSFPTGMQNQVFSRKAP